MLPLPAPPALRPAPSPATAAPDPADLALARTLRARLADIGVGDDAAFCREVLAVFASDVVVQVAGIARALAAADSAALTRAAHALKGSAANMHATALADASLTIERLGKASALGDVSGALDRLRADAARVPRAVALILSE